MRHYHAQAQHKKRFDTNRIHTITRTDVPNVETQPILEGFQCPVKKYQCKACHKFGHFTSMCFQKKQANFKPRRPKVHQLQVGAVYAKGSASYDHTDDESTSEDSFCLQVKTKCKQDKEQKVPRPTHLITNLAYRLKPHHTRNLYLRARLDTCTDVNLMPASMYQLVFNYAKMQKLAP